MALFFHRLESTKKSRIFKEKASFYQFIINKPHYNSYIIYIYLNIKEKIQNLEKNFFQTKSLPLNYHFLLIPIYKTTDKSISQEVSSELCQLTTEQSAGQK